MEAGSTVQTEMTVVFAALFFIAGAVTGSFSDCMAWRSVRGGGFWGRSACGLCGHRLGFTDLIPLAGYIVRRGRCRYCGGRIPLRHFLTELLCAFIFTFCYLRLGIGIDLIRVLVLTSLLLPAALVDIDTKTVPNIYFILLFLIWICLVPFEPDKKTYLTGAALGGLLIPLIIWGISAVMSRLLGRMSLGGGDIKLLFSTGLYLGLGRSLVNIVLMCVIGLAYGIFSRDRDDGSFAFVPAIAAATLICHVFGGSLLALYFGLFDMEVSML